MFNFFYNQKVKIIVAYGYASENCSREFQGTIIGSNDLFITFNTGTKDLYINPKFIVFIEICE